MVVENPDLSRSDETSSLLSDTVESRRARTRWTVGGASALPFFPPLVLRQLRHPMLRLCAEDEISVRKTEMPDGGCPEELALVPDPAGGDSKAA